MPCQIAHCFAGFSFPLVVFAFCRYRPSHPNGLKTVVSWTLTPTKGGTLVRMEQSGFRLEEEANYQGATYGWQRFFGGLERVVAGLD